MAERLARFARGALSGVFFLSYALAALPFAPILILPVWTPRRVRRVIRAFYRLFVLFGRRTGLFTVEIAGGPLANRRGATGRIVVMNHTSLVDIAVLLAHLGDATGLAKAATLKNPCLGMVVRKMFIVHRDDYEKTLAEVRACLAAGVDVVVFPEGTRIPASHADHPLHRGAARLALATGAKILCLHADYDPPVLGKGQPWWDVGARTIRIRIGNRGLLTARGTNCRANAVGLTTCLGGRIRCD